MNKFILIAMVALPFFAYSQSCPPLMHYTLQGEDVLFPYDQIAKISPHSSGGTLITAVDFKFNCIVDDDYGDLINQSCGCLLSINELDQGQISLPRSIIQEISPGYNNTTLILASDGRQVVKYRAAEDIASVIAELTACSTSVIDTDDQQIDNISYVGGQLCISLSGDLIPPVCVTIPSSDDQNIVDLSLDGSILTVEIEDGNITTVDLGGVAEGGTITAFVTNLDTTVTITEAGVPWTIDLAPFFDPCEKEFVSAHVTPHICVGEQYELTITGALNGSAEITEPDEGGITITNINTDPYIFTIPFPTSFNKNNGVYIVEVTTEDGCVFEIGTSMVVDTLCFDHCVDKDVRATITPHICAGEQYDLMILGAQDGSAEITEPDEGGITITTINSDPYIFTIPFPTSVAKNNGNYNIEVTTDDGCIFNIPAQMVVDSICLDSCDIFNPEIAQAPYVCEGDQYDITVTDAAGSTLSILRPDLATIDFVGIILTDPYNFTIPFSTTIASYHGEHIYTITSASGCVYEESIYLRVDTCAVEEFTNNIAYITPSGSDVDYKLGYPHYPAKTYNFPKTNGFTNNQTQHVFNGTYVVDPTDNEEDTELGVRGDSINWYFEVGSKLVIDGATDGVLGLRDFASIANSANESRLSVKGDLEIDFTSPASGNDVLFGVYEHNAIVDIELDKISCTGKNFIIQSQAKEQYFSVRNIKTPGTVVAPYPTGATTPNPFNHHYKIGQLHTLDKIATPFRFQAPSTPDSSSFIYEVDNWFVSTESNGMNGLAWSQTSPDLSYGPKKFDMRITSTIGRHTLADSLLYFDSSSNNTSGGVFSFGGSASGAFSKGWAIHCQSDNVDWDVPTVQIRGVRLDSSIMTFDIVKSIANVQPAITFNDFHAKNHSQIVFNGGSYETRANNQPAVLYGHLSGDCDSTSYVLFKDVEFITRAPGMAAFNIDNGTPGTGPNHITLIFEDVTFITDGTGPAIETNGSNEFEVVIINCRTNSTVTTAGNITQIGETIQSLPGIRGL